MSDLIWLSEAQMRRIERHFPLSHGVPRVDDRRIISGIIFVIRNGLRWRDAPDPRLTWRVIQGAEGYIDLVALRARDHTPSVAAQVFWDAVRAEENASG